MKSLDNEIFKKAVEYVDFTLFPNSIAFEIRNIIFDIKFSDEIICR